MTDYRQAAAAAARRAGIDPKIFVRQINAESGFNPNAGSGAGAVGIAQFMPATARSLGINPHNPIQALEGAAKLMAGYVKKYGSYDNALRAYNAGEGAIKASHGYGETNAYVAKILHGQDPGGTQHSATTSGPRTITTPGTAPVVDSKRAILDALMAHAANPNGSLLHDQLSRLQSGAYTTPGTAASTTTTGGEDVVTRAAAAGGKGRVTVAAGANRSGVALQKPIMNFLSQLAGVSGRTVNVTTGTNHNQMTTSGNVSDHWGGNATDLGVGGDARQSKTVSRRGDLIAAHAIQVAANIPFAKAYAMATRGGLWNFETKHGRVQIIWKTMTGGDHFNHVHVGVNPRR